MGKPMVGAGPFLLALSLLGCEQGGSLTQPAGTTGAPNSPVIDTADMMPAAQETRLRESLSRYWDEEGVAIVVHTVPHLEGMTIEKFALDRFNEWGIGDEATHRGVLIVVARDERKARIEVGCGLETVLTDDVAQQILDRNMLPEFRASDYPSGIARGVDRLIDIIETSSIRPGPTSAACLDMAA